MVKISIGGSKRELCNLFKKNAGIVGSQVQCAGNLKYRNFVVEPAIKAVKQSYLPNESEPNLQTASIVVSCTGEFSTAPRVRLPIQRSTHMKFVRNVIKAQLRSTTRGI